MSQYTADFKQCDDCKEYKLSMNRHSHADRRSSHTSGPSIRHAQDPCSTTTQSLYFRYCYHFHHIYYQTDRRSTWCPQVLWMCCDYWICNMWLWFMMCWTYCVWQCCIWMSRICTLWLCVVWVSDLFRISFISRRLFLTFNTRFNTTFGYCLLWCLCAVHTEISIISISMHFLSILMAMKLWTLWMRMVQMVSTVTTTEHEGVSYNTR